MDVLVVVDMQEATPRGDTKYDFSSVVARINRLAWRVRRGGGRVVFIQHDGRPDDDFAPHSPGWAILSSLERDPSDLVVHKTLNDAFFGTTLQTDLDRLAADRLLAAGWATDFCVDATVRSAAALGFKVVVAEDCHTVSDRSHLSAERVIEYHHWLWANVLSPHPVRFAREADL